MSHTRALPDLSKDVAINENPEQICRAGLTYNELPLDVPYGQDRVRKEKIHYLRRSASIST
jgi:hypothetical protein